MILKSLNRAFGGIDSVIMGFDEQEIAFVRLEELFYLSACLIVHHIQFNCKTFACEELKLFFVGGVDRRVFQVWDWESEDSV